MNNARNWYIYIVSAVTLHGVSWAVISLLRILFLGDVFDKSSLALQLSILIIGLPAYLVHWLWGQRLARREREERVSIQRQLFLFGALAGSLAPAINNVFQILNQVFVTRESNAFAFNIIPIIVLSLIFIYHYLIQKEAQSDLREEESFHVLRQIFIHGFALTGLSMFFLGSVTLLSILIYQIANEVFGSGLKNVITEVIRLLVGTLVWGYFWNFSQQLFKKSPEDEPSIYRWIYLYLIVIISTIATVTSITIILVALLRSLFYLKVDITVFDIMPTLIMMGIFWFYHAYVLQSSKTRLDVEEKQTRIRWLYHYLVAVVGIVAYVIGLIGLIHIFIRVVLIGNSFAADLKGDFCIYVSMVLAGFPTWVLAWRRIISRIKRDKDLKERNSSIRKFYLYLLILGATLTLVHGLIYLVYQFLLRLLGEATLSSFLPDIVVFIANIIVASLVLGYHWKVLRSDSKLIKQEDISQHSLKEVAVLEDLEGNGRKILESLQSTYPGLNPVLINPFRQTEKKEEHLGKLVNSDLIVVPTSIISSESISSNEYFQAALSSSGKKVLIPQRMHGFEWVGVRLLDSRNISKKALKTIGKIMAGESQISEKPLGCLAIGGIVIGAIILLTLIIQLVDLLLYL